MFVSIKPLHVSAFFHDHLQGVNCIASATSNSDYFMPIAN
jgi:hypothetical protein